jgi:hypothetical protein
MALDSTPEAEPWPPSFFDLRSADWLAPSEAAWIARVTLRTIRRWIARYPIAMKVGGRVHVKRHRLASLVAVGHRDGHAA